MTTLAVALDRLIHKRSYRINFLGGHDVSDLSEADAAALKTTDPRTLSELSSSIAHDLLARKHAGSGSLLDLYPRTIQAFRLRHDHDEATLELSYRFMDSEAFDGYREFPHAGPGLTLEEAFYRFAEAEGLGDPIVREAEYLAAIAKLMCASPTIDAAIPPEFRRARGGYFAVSGRGAPILYGALLGRFVTGPLTPFLAALLADQSRYDETAERHRVSKAVLTESLRRLSDLGIL
jgi:hypothetical protein